MQRKSYAYVPGVAVLLTALLTGCSGSSGSDSGVDDSKPGDVSSSAASAKPGKYRTLPEPCVQPDKAMLDTMLPGIKALPDEEQRDKAYEGTAATTFDTDRRAGCRWKDDSAQGGTHWLELDFERVVSYEGSVSDDSRASDVFAAKELKADLPAAGATSTQEPAPDETKSDEKKGKESKGAGGEPSGAASSEGSGEPGTPSSADASSSADAEALQPRVLDDLGDEAFVDDALTGPTTSRHRTVTVVFRTSNVVVTVEYRAQSATVDQAPDSKEMQDMARELAAKLVGKFAE